MASTDRPLAGTVAIVTGASRGLGRWFAVDLAASGADLMLVARSVEGLAGTAELATAEGARCETMAGDVCDDDLARAVVAATCERLGPVDLLVNNAGVGTPALVSDQGIDEWWHVATVNLRAPVMWTMAVLPGMRRRGSGRIINVSSPAALHSPLPYYSSYTASKAGLSQFTAAFAQEVAAEGICVLAFGPRGVDGHVDQHVRERRASDGDEGRLLDRVRHRPRSAATTDDGIVPADGSRGRGSPQRRLPRRR